MLHALSLKQKKEIAIKDEKTFMERCDACIGSFYML